MNLLLSKAKSAFIRHYLGKDKSKLTVKRYDALMIRLLNFWGDVEISQITNQMVDDYRIERIKNGLKGVTINYELSIFRAFLIYIEKNYPSLSCLKKNQIEFSNQQKREIVIPTLEEVKKLINAPGLDTLKGIRNTSILLLLFSSGLRVSELISLNKDDLDFKGLKFKVIGKGRKKRNCFFSEEASKTIQVYLTKRGDDHFPALFISIRSGYDDERSVKDIGRLTPVSIQQMIKEYVEKLDIKSRITPHTLRHVCATFTLGNGMDMREVQEMLGHSSITTTQGYTHLIPGRLQADHAKVYNSPSSRVLSQ